MAKQMGSRGGVLEGYVHGGWRSLEATFIDTSRVCVYPPSEPIHHASGFAPTNMFSLTPCTKWVFPLPLLLRWR